MAIGLQILTNGTVTTSEHPVSDMIDCIAATLDF